MKGAKVLSYGDDSRIKLLSGVKQMYEAVGSTYGPLATNVLLQKEWGAPVLTRDGVTVAKDIMLDDPIENMAAEVVKQAAETTNRLAGDGTTATVVLAYHLVAEAMKHIAFGANPMELRKKIMDASKAVVRYVVTQHVKVTDDKIQEVATVSCGDPAIGKLIAEALIEVGERGGVMVEEHEALGIKLEFVEGFHFNAGTYAMDKLKLLFTPTLVLVTERPLNANSDILPILQYVTEQDVKRVVIIGELTGDAANTFVLNQKKGAYDGCGIMPNLSGLPREWFFEDLAKYCGGKVVKPGDPLEKATLGDFFGKAEKVIVTENSTTVFGGDAPAEDVKSHADKVAVMLKEETNDYKIEQLEMRLNRLTGKIATLKVGAATPVEKEELRYRIDDAIQAARAAREGGIVPGGATVLLRASKLPGLDPLVANALTQPFKKLMANGGESVDYRTMQALNTKTGWGFNLREMSDKPVDLLKAGVIDPTKVIVQVVQNACSVAGNLITTNCVVAIAEEPKNEQPNNQN